MAPSELFATPLPSLCTICAAYRADCIVPDRSDVGFPFGYDVMCTVCLDAFLPLFPIRPSDLAAREVEGRLRGRRNRAPPGARVGSRKKK